MTVFYADEPIEPKSIVACPECGFEFCFNHSEGWSEEGYRFVCYRCHAEQAERERDEARREVERLRRVAEAAEAVVSAQDKRWRIGLKGEAERNGAIERLRSALAEWRRVRGE